MASRTPFATRVVDRLGGPAAAPAKALLFAIALITRYSVHRGSLSAGGIAFFAALALAPMAIAISAIAGLFVDPQRLRDGLAALIDEVPAAASLEPFVNQLANLAASTSAAGFTVTGLISLVIALFAASRVVLAGRQVLDVAFDRENERRGFAARLVATVVTLLVLLGALALILLLTVLPAILSALSIDGWFLDALRGPLSPLISLALVYALVRWVYSRGPRREGPGRRVIGAWSPGAAAAALWLLLVGVGLDLYVTRSASWGVTVAILGGAAILLLWLYLCAVGLVIGAEWEGLRTSQRGAEPAESTSDTVLAASAESKPADRPR